MPRRSEIYAIDRHISQQKTIAALVAGQRSRFVAVLAIVPDVGGSAMPGGTHLLSLPSASDGEIANPRLMIVTDRLAGPALLDRVLGVALPSGEDQLDCIVGCVCGDRDQQVS